MEDQEAEPVEQLGTIKKEDVPSSPTKTSLREAQAFQQIKREESSRDHIHRAKLIVFWALIMAGGVAGITWLWHTLAPVSWHYLDSEQTKELTNILASVIGSTFLARHFSDWLGRNG